MIVETYLLLDRIVAPQTPSRCWQPWLQWSSSFRAVACRWQSFRSPPPRWSCPRWMPPAHCIQSEIMRKILGYSQTQSGIMVPRCVYSPFISYLQFQIDSWYSNLGHDMCVFVSIQQLSAPTLAKYYCKIIFWWRFLWESESFHLCDDLLRVSFIHEIFCGMFSRFCQRNSAQNILLSSLAKYFSLRSINEWQPNQLQGYVTTLTFTNQVSSIV